jgi:hypothetical protein
MVASPGLALSLTGTLHKASAVGLVTGRAGGTGDLERELELDSFEWSENWGAWFFKF